MGSESGSIKGGSTNQNITTSETKAGYPIGGYCLSLQPDISIVRKK